MSGPRALLIANPAAARTGPEAVAAVRRVLRRAGWRAEVRATIGPGDARTLAEEAVAEGMDVVAVFGGDGTVMQAAAALVGTGTSLGLIPGGTGNLLAGNLRIPASPGRAAEAMVRAAPRPFDLGRMERPDGVHYFAVACGAGYDARVMTATQAAAKHRWGMLAYTATTFRLLGELRSRPHRITVDGTAFEARAAMVLVANCSEVIPPFVRMGPGIRPDDGILDVVVVRAENLPTAVRAVWDILRSRSVARGDGAFVAYARGREITVATDEPEPVQLDGDPGGVTPFTATVVPAAVRILVPGS